MQTFTLAPGMNFLVGAYHTVQCKCLHFSHERQKRNFFRWPAGGPGRLNKLRSEKRSGSNEWAASANGKNSPLQFDAGYELLPKPGEPRIRFVSWEPDTQAHRCSICDWLLTCNCSDRRPNVSNVWRLTGSVDIVYIFAVLLCCCCFCWCCRNFIVVYCKKASCFIIKSCKKMSWSGLEVIGLIVTVYVMWCIVGAVWNLLYTCYIGSALGRAIDVRRLGSWAGQ